MVTSYPVQLLSPLRYLLTPAHVWGMKHPQKVHYVYTHLLQVALGRVAEEQLLCVDCARGEQVHLEFLR